MRLSIIIPTHERIQYCHAVVSAILDNTHECEVVISDTSEKDTWIDFGLRWVAEGRLRIIRPGVPMSVVENFNVALNHASGEYLCFIGDDDLVAPEIEQIANWAAEINADSVNFTFPIVYYWPDYLHCTYPSLYSGSLWTSSFSGDVERHDTKASLNEALEKLGLGVLSMPRAYCGLVSRELVTRIQQNHGRLFGGVSPDIYSAALIALHARNALKVDFPAIMPGASGSSTAGQSAAGKHVGGLRDNAHIAAFKNLVWNPDIPEFYSVPTVWGFSLQAAMKSADGSRWSPDVQPNYGRLYARCIVFHRAFLKEICRSIRERGRRVGALQLAGGILAGFFSEAVWIFMRLADRVKHQKKCRVDYSVTQPAEVMQLLPTLLEGVGELPWRKVQK